MSKHARLAGVGAHEKRGIAMMREERRGEGGTFRNTIMLTFVAHMLLGAFCTSLCYFL